MRKPFAPLLLLVVIGFLVGCTSPLINAARQGDVKSLEDILQRGADINESNGNGGYVPQLGLNFGMIAMFGTALHHASYSCKLEAMKLLIDKSADVNKMAGSSPLYFAGASGCNEGVKLLLEKGADINARGRWGSPLSVAAVMGNGSTAKLLIERGADVDDAIGYLRSVDKQKYTLGAQLIETISGKDAAQRKIASVPAMPLPKPYPEVSGTLKSDVDEIPSIKAKAKPNKNAYAIVIGIEQYRQKLPKADFAMSDARLVSEYLSKMMGYPEENIVTLTNENATKSDFEKYFEKWLSNNAEKDSTVFVYYSGHGAPNPKTGDAYLVPYDGDPSFISETGYSLKRMYDALGKLPAKEIIVVLDSCFSGAGGRSVLAKGARPLVMNLQDNAVLSKNITILSASSGDQISSTYDEKGHGLFTYFMLKGIKNEDVVNPDGSIKMDDLFGYIKPQVERIARRQYNSEQSPQLIGAKKN